MTPGPEYSWLTMQGGAIDILVRFSRMASEASSGTAILPLLADAAIEQLQADGAVVVEVTTSGALCATTARGVAPGLAAWRGRDGDVIGDELGDELVARSEGRFTRAAALPLVSQGGLFGALVLLFAEGTKADATSLQVARGLVDLAAIAVARAEELAKLGRINAELRSSREALARTEKLRALGQMAAGVSHDLKNILNPLSLHAQMAKRALGRGEPEKAAASIDECQAVLRRGVETVDRLRAFSRQAPEARASRADLGQLVQEAAAIARPRLASRSDAAPRIELQLGGAPAVVVHADEVVAAIVNLVVNAIDAMPPQGGTITLRTAAREGGAAVIVEDDGPGMSPEVQARVFEPFFTTKGAEGTGLGLAMVFATMQRHSGWVTVETSPGKGATFTLWFPGAPPPRT